MPNNHRDYDLCVCEVTRATYMAMLNEFRTINPNLRDRVDEPPVEDDNITYLALVGKAKGEKWHPPVCGQSVRRSAVRCRVGEHRYRLRGRAVQDATRRAGTGG